MKMSKFITRYRIFREKCESQTTKEDVRTGRKYNRDSFSHWIREAAYLVLYFLLPLGFRGHHFLFIHFGIDLMALYFVWKEMPIAMFVCMMTAHWIDNMDGVAARYRNESHDDWGRLDILLHLLALMIFWIIVGCLTKMWVWIVALLSFQVVNMWHRAQLEVKGEKFVVQRWGEKSYFWKLSVLPTNVAWIYTFYMIFALMNQLDLFIMGYTFYLGLAAMGQSIWFGYKTYRLLSYENIGSHASS